MKPDIASRLLYQEAALRSFLRSDSIAQSFIQNTPNYNMEDLQQLYFASAAIKSKKMLIEFVKISTKQLCRSMRDKIPLFKYLNPDNISTDLTDDELMLLIHEASHSMNLEKQVGSHGNIAFLVAKNIIFNLVGVNATATLNSFLKTPDFDVFNNKEFHSNSNLISTPTSSAIPMPASSVNFASTQSVTSLPLTIPTPSTLTSVPSTPYMPSYGSSPTIISTSIANVSFVSMNSSMPPNTNSLTTVSTSNPTIHSVTQRSPTLAITERPHVSPQTNTEIDFDSRSNASESSNTRFEVIGENQDDNIKNDFDQNRGMNDLSNRIDANYGEYNREDDRMSIESDRADDGDDESGKSEDNEVENDDGDDESGKSEDNEVENVDDGDESERSDDKGNIDDNEDNTVDNYQMTNNHKSPFNDLYDEEQRSFEQELIHDEEIKRVFSINELDNKFKDNSGIKEIDDPEFKTPPASSPPTPPFVESPRKFPLRKKPRKRKAPKYTDDTEEVENKIKPEKKNQNEPWLDPGVDFKSIDESIRQQNFYDMTDGGDITNINEVVEQTQSEKRKLFAEDSMYNIMDDLKRKGVLNIPSSPRHITFSNVDT